MDRTRLDTGRRDRAALRRIVSLLLAMAGLAEAACGRSAPVRWLVLLILGSAETVARDHVARLTGVPAFTPPTRMAIDPDAGIMEDSVARAMRLAFVFRALAAALGTALAALPDEAAAPAPPATGLAALRDLIAARPVERRDSS